MAYSNLLLLEKVAIQMMSEVIHELAVKVNNTSGLVYSRCKALSRAGGPELQEQWKIKHKSRCMALKPVSAALHMSSFMVLELSTRWIYSVNA